MRQSWQVTVVGAAVRLARTGRGAARGFAASLYARPTGVEFAIFNDPCFCLVFDLESVSASKPHVISSMYKNDHRTGFTPLPFHLISTLDLSTEWWELTASLFSSIYYIFCFSQWYLPVHALDMLGNFIKHYNVAHLWFHFL